VAETPLIPEHASPVVRVVVLPHRILLGSVHGVSGPCNGQVLSPSEGQWRRARAPGSEGVVWHVRFISGAASQLSSLVPNHYTGPWLGCRRRHRTNVLKFVNYN
jgi:hypothetical protein